MKNHKRNDPEHDYCNKCDVDCDSWDDYVEHKANANPKVHIACLHCGQDFKSIPGRNRHIAQVSCLSGGFVFLVALQSDIMLFSLRFECLSFLVDSMK